MYSAERKFQAYQLVAMSHQMLMLMSHSLALVVRNLAAVHFSQEHIPELKGDVLDSIPDCKPAAKVGKNPLLHQELVYDGEDEANEDKEHEGNDDGEDDDGDCFSKV